MSVDLLNRKLAQRGLLGTDDLQTTTAWTRNSNWIAMPTITDSDQKIAILTAVFNNDTNKVAFTITGNYSVDWGDGSTENVNSGVMATHNYVYSDADLNSDHPDYKQALIVITPQSGQNLTSANFHVREAGFGNNGYGQNWLDVKLSMPNATSTTSLTWGNNNETSTTKFYKLERINIVKFGSTNKLSCNNLFAYMMNLRRVEFGTGLKVTDLASAFQNCRSLTEFPTLDLDSAGVGLGGAFDNCRTMTTMPAITNLQYVTSWTGAFSNCYSLIYTYPITETNTSITSYSSMFSNCHSLEQAPYIKINNNAGSSINFGSVFSNCYSLKRVPLYDLSRATRVDAIFQNCYSLETVPKFNTTNITNFASMFSGCYSLLAVPLFDTSAATDTSSMFSDCRSLRSVPAFSLSNSTNCASMFQNCYSLITTPAFNISKATSTASMFQNCYSLKTIGELTTSTTLLTSTTSMFNTAYRLESVPLFNTNAVTTANIMFGTCSTIKEIPSFVFSSVTNAASIFSGCSSLSKITALNFGATTNVSSMFNGCLSMREIPAVTFNSSSTGGLYFGSVVNNCPNLTKFAATNINATISVANCALGATELNAIYTNLSNTGTGKTITVSGNWGTASDDPTIATAKGWTVTG